MFFSLHVLVGCLRRLFPILPDESNLSEVFFLEENGSDKHN